MSAKSNQGSGGRRVVIEIPAVDKRILGQVWSKMREGAELTGQEQYIGRSMADHPEWFPIFETIDVLAGDDALPDGTNPIAHITFHVLVGSQVFNRSPPEAEVFYRMRIRKGDDPHQVIHMMINVFQRHLMWAAEHATPEGKAPFDRAAYAKTLRTLWPLKSNKLWQRLGHAEAPRRAHEPAAKR